MPTLESLMHVTCFNAVVVGGVRISQGIIIGAGAAETRDVERYSVMGGRPREADSQAKVTAILVHAMGEGEVSRM